MAKSTLALAPKCYLTFQGYVCDLMLLDNATSMFFSVPYIVKYQEIIVATISAGVGEQELQPSQGLLISRNNFCGLMQKLKRVVECGNILNGSKASEYDQEMPQSQNTYLLKAQRGRDTTAKRQLK